MAKNQQNNLFIGLFIIALGVFFLAREFGWIPMFVNVGDFWPVILIAVGVWFIFGKQ